MELNKVLEGSVTFDGTSITLIRDGKSVQITEEEYRKMHPFHKDVGCKECCFVSSADDVLLYHVSRELKEAVGREPVFIGKFCEPGMMGHSPYYIFKCQFCGHVSAKNISGKRRLYCVNCKEQTNLDPVKNKNILGLSSADVRHYKGRDRMRRNERRAPWYRRLFLLVLLVAGYFVFRALG